MGLMSFLKGFKKKNPLFNQRVNVSPYPDKILRIGAEQRLNQFQNPLTAGYEKPTPSEIWGKATKMAGPSREVTVPGRGWDKDLLGEVLGDVMGNVDTTPLPGKRVGETNIGELSLLQQAGPEVGDISTSMDRFWKKKLGYA